MSGERPPAGRHSAGAKRPVSASTATPAAPRPRPAKGAPPGTITGEVVIRGKTRSVAVRPSRPTVGHRRYAVVPDIDGPRVRFAIVWFAAVVGALVVGPVAVAAVYCTMAGLAGYQAALAWQQRGSGANPFVAAGLAVAVGASGLFGVRMLGLALVVAVLAAVVTGVVTFRQHHSLLEAGGTIVQCAVAPGIAAASVLLTLRLEIGAVVVLVLLVSAFEVGDFVVGSGASTAIEGPVAGFAAVGVMCLVLAVLRVPPFDGTAIYVFGGFTAVLCPVGQLVGSAVLPTADAKAPALRRLDSLIVLGPAWVVLVGILLDRLAS